LCIKSIGKCLNIVIDGKLGDYYGELRLSRYKKPVPHGCGLHYCKDKTYLGYLENGSWVIGSERLVATSLYYRVTDNYENDREVIEAVEEEIYNQD